MMRKSYDFSNAVRGAHYKRYAEGHSVRVMYEEEAQTPELESDTEKAGDDLAEPNVVLDADVRAAFPDSRAVNEALRLLIKAAKGAKELAKAS